MSAGLNATLRNARLDAITTFAGSGCKLRIYNGTRPATGGSVTTLLSEHTLGTPFAGSASAGVLTVTPPSDVNASNTGTATWARITKSDGTTHVMDLSVGTSGTDVILNSTSFTSGVAVSVTAISITEGNA